MPILSAIDITKIYGTRRVLDGVSLTIHAGERIGVVGANGSGKSTLGSILAGAEDSDSGTLALRRGATVGYLAQDPEIAPGRDLVAAVLDGLNAWKSAHARFEAATRALAEGRADEQRALAEQAAAAEAVERAGGWDLTHEAEAMLARLGVADPHAPVEHASGGRRRAVALARVLLSRPDLAILDEPTNHLDIATIEWLEDHLAREFTGALLLITHDRYVLDAATNRTVELERGRLTSFDGGYETWLEARAERAAHAERTDANRRNFLRTELEWLRRSPKARTGKQRARIQRAESAAAEQAAMRRESAADRRAEFAADAVRSGRTVLELDGVGIDMAGRRLVDDLSLSIVAGERLGVVGPNGCGKTSLLRTITGELASTRGEVRAGRNTAIAYLDQTRGVLDDTASVQENIAGNTAMVAVGGRELTVRSYLERFLFDGADARRAVGSLSGGERARVALARLLAGRANVLVLDEPTNDLDVDTLAALEDMLLEYPGTVLVVSHDRWFLDRLATSLLVFEDDGRVVRHAGGYSDYKRRVEARTGVGTGTAPAPAPAAGARAGADKPDAATVPAAPARPRKLTYAERLELEGLYEKVEAAEARVAALEERVADPALYSGGGGERAREVLAELDAARVAAAALAERWLELETRATEGAN